MTTKILIVTGFLFFSINASAQLRMDRAPLSIDSLRRILPSLSALQRIDCLNELARAYCEKSTIACTDSALSTLKQAYTESSSYQYEKGLGDACIQYAIVYTLLVPDFLQSEKYCRDAISWYEKIGDSNGLGFGYRGLGIIFLNQGAIEQSSSAFTRASFYFREAGNKIMLADITDWFGLVYNAKGDFEHYFELIKKGFHDKQTLHDTRGIVWSFYRLAFIHAGVEDYETALEYLRLGLRSAVRESVPWQIYRSLGRMFLNIKNYDSSEYYFTKLLQINPSDGGALAGLGQLYLYKKEYHKALPFLRNALFTFTRQGDKAAPIWVVADMGRTSVGLKQYDAALEYAHRCLLMARQINNTQAIQYAYECNWKVYDALRYTDSAYYYYGKFMTLKDSLDHAKFKRQHLQKLALYRVESKEEEQQAHIDMLNKDNQLKQQQLRDEAIMKKILIGSFGIMVLLGIIIFRNIALKRKNEKHRRELAENELQIQKLESEKTKAELQQQATVLEMQALRAQMNPHFIFNCLSSINRFILKNETEAASDYLTKFSRLIRMVLTNSKKAFINLEDELDMLRLYLDMERLRFKNSFDYEIRFKNEIEPENIFIPPLLLQPFAENAIWHGLMHKEGKGHLEIELSIDKKILTCIITDDGIGRNKAAIIKSRSAEKQKSMGLQITTERLALLNHDMDEQTFFNIEDITDDEGNVAGTRVILKLYYKDMVEAFV